jgi:hypothetical protein
MTAEEWLVARDPAPPASLAERLRRVLARHDPAARARPSAELYLTAGEELLQELLLDGCTSRESALDLLTADALVTYAFEAASLEPELLGARAQHAMTRIAALAGDAAA